MTANKTYTMAVEIIRAADAENAEAIIKNPHFWKTCGDAIIKNACEMLIDGLAQMDSKTTARGTVAAVKRICTSAAKMGRANLAGIWEKDGKYFVCDGFRALRLNEDITALEHVAAETAPRVEDLMNRAEVEKTAVLELPTAAEIKAHIAAAGGAKNARQNPLYIGGLVAVNPVYLLDMLQALPGCVAYVTKNNVSPVYFVADNGDGILCPVRPADEKLEEIRANWEKLTEKPEPAPVVEAPAEPEPAQEPETETAPETQPETVEEEKPEEAAPGWTGRADYEERRAARVERYENAAAAAEARADRLQAPINNMRGDTAFFTQPNINSASGRAFTRRRERMFSSYEKGHAEREKAAYYTAKAETAAENGVISSDDPAALDKLRAKLEKLEEAQRKMKAVNAYYKKHQTFNGCPDITETTAAKIVKSWNNGWYTGIPFAPYELQNNGANIRRIKDRIAELEKRASAPAPAGWDFDGGRVVANVAENRYQVIFDAIPDEGTRDALKKSGFRWSRFNKAWQRLLNENTLYTLRRLSFLAPVETADEADEEPAEIESEAPQAETVTEEPPAAAPEVETIEADPATLPRRLHDPLDVFRPGDIVKTENTGFKSQSGYFLIEEVTNNALYLVKTGTTGKIRDDARETWPPRHYCNDRRKNQEAYIIDRESATICRVDNIPTAGAYNHFKRLAQNRRDRAENFKNYPNTYTAEEIEKELADAARLDAIAERIKPETMPAEVDKTGIKFYYNGIRVDGGKLIQCYYYEDQNGEMNISAKNYKDLPGKYFEVVNESDSQSDYFEDDRATVEKENPLYKFARFAWLKGIINGKTYRTPTEAQRAEWETMTDPGQPTAADLDALQAYYAQKQQERAEAEEAERRARAELVEREKTEGRAFIEKTAAENPIQTGAPYVIIRWSEYPAFYNWADDELKLSIAAADIILTKFDNDVDKTERGYFKTKFSIEYTDQETGEAAEFTDRYDIGDKNGGLIAMIRNIDPGGANGKFADMLQSWTPGGVITAVEMPIDFKKAAEKIKEKREAQAREEWDNILDAVAMLTDKQIENVIFSIDPQDGEKKDVARFFLQELSRRDEAHALEVFREWTKGRAI